MFSMIAKNKDLGGYYSLIEDFKRYKISATQTRKAEFGIGWFANTNGEWNPLREACFQADRNPVLNIDAGLTKNSERFFLITGGEAENATTKLKENLALPKETKSVEPKDWAKWWEKK